MAPDTRRRVVFVVAALIIVALVLASTGCSSTTGSDADDATDDDGPELSGALYPASMNEICAATTDRLAQLPTPPEEISRADWASEVSLALRDEAIAFDEIRVGESRRTDHASFIENTENQSAQWMSLSEALAGDAPDDAVLSDVTTEIAELTLGRDDLATEMGLAGCQAREVG